MKNWKLVLGIMAFGQLICVAGWQAGPPFFPYYVRELGVVGSAEIKIWAGALLSADAASMALMSPVWGIIADRVGARIMVQRAALGGCLFLLLQGFATSAPQLFALRLLLGAVTGTIPAFMTLVAAVVPETNTGFALGIMQMSVYGGLALGPVMGAFLADTYGYRSIFFASSACFLLTLLLVSFLVPKPAARLHHRAPRGGVIQGVQGTLRMPGVLGAMLVLGFIYLGNMAYRPLLPLLVESLPVRAEMLNRTTGFAFAAIAITAAASAVVAGRLSDRVGQRLTIVGCSIGAAVGLVGQAVSWSVPMLIAAALISGFSIGGLTPTVNTLMARMTGPHQRGTVYGMSNSVNSVARAIGPMLGTSVAAAAGLRLGFVSAALMFLLVLLVAHQLPRVQAGQEAETLAHSTAEPI